MNNTYIDLRLLSVYLILLAMASINAFAEGPEAISVLETYKKSSRSASYLPNKNDGSHILISQSYNTLNWEWEATYGILNQKVYDPKKRVRCADLMTANVITTGAIPATLINRYSFAWYNQIYLGYDAEPVCYSLLDSFFNIARLGNRYGSGPLFEDMRVLGGGLYLKGSGYFEGAPQSEYAVGSLSSIENYLTFKKNITESTVIAPVAATKIDYKIGAKKTETGPGPVDLSKIKGPYLLRVLASYAVVKYEFKPIDMRVPLDGSTILSLSDEWADRFFNEPAGKLVRTEKTAMAVRFSKKFYSTHPSDLTERFGGCNYTEEVPVGIRNLGWMYNSFSFLPVTKHLCAKILPGIKTTKKYTDYIGFLYRCPYAQTNFMLQCVTYNER